MTARKNELTNYRNK